MNQSKPLITGWKWVKQQGQKMINKVASTIQVQGGICRGGKPGNFPLTGSDLPPHWFV